ncbi:MAG: Sec-independent protein translocase protein TatB [Gammaproteobacteria bacterium]
MFDVGFWELAVIGVVALLVLGPERLPRAVRTAGLWISKARRTVTTMKAEIERELDIEEMKKAVDPETIDSLQEFQKDIKESLTIDESDMPDFDDINLKDEIAAFESELKDQKPAPQIDSKLQDQK